MCEACSCLRHSVGLSWENGSGAAKLDLMENSNDDEQVRDKMQRRLQNNNVTRNEHYFEIILLCEQLVKCNHNVETKI